LQALDAWWREGLHSYRPEELFDEAGAPVAVVRDLYPRGRRRMSATPHADDGELLQPLRMPDVRDYAVPVPAPGTGAVEAPRVLGTFLRDVMRQNPTNTRVFAPDENNSNRLGGILEVTERAWMTRREPDDVQLAPDGLIMEVLSEHLCQGWLEGTQTGGDSSSLAPFRGDLDEGTGREPIAPTQGPLEGGTPVLRLVGEPRASGNGWGSPGEDVRIRRCRHPGTGPELVCRMGGAGQQPLIGLRAQRVPRSGRLMRLELGARVQPEEVVYRVAVAGSRLDEAQVGELVEQALCMRLRLVEQCTGQVGAEGPAVDQGEPPEQPLGRRPDLREGPFDRRAHVQVPGGQCVQAAVRRSQAFRQPRHSPSGTAGQAVARNAQRQRDAVAQPRQPVQVRPGGLLGRDDGAEQSPCVLLRQSVHADPFGRLEPGQGASAGHQDGGPSRCGQDRADLRFGSGVVQDQQRRSVGQQRAQQPGSPVRWALLSGQRSQHPARDHFGRRWARCGPADVDEQLLRKGIVEQAGRADSEAGLAEAGRPRDEDHGGPRAGQRGHDPRQFLASPREVAELARHGQQRRDSGPRPPTSSTCGLEQRSTVTAGQVQGPRDRDNGPVLRPAGDSAFDVTQRPITDPGGLRQPLQGEVRREPESTDHRADGLERHGVPPAGRRPDRCARRPAVGGGARPPAVPRARR
jgi:hypothetical protein